MVAVRPFDAAEDRAWRALIRIATLLPRHLNNELLDAGRVSLSEFGLLIQLSRSDRGTLRLLDLAEATGLSASRVTRAIETMRGRGWVEKLPDATDGRATRVVLTEAGLDQMSRAYEVQVAGARRILFDGLTTADAEELGRLLDGLVRILQQEDRVD